MDTPSLQSAAGLSAQLDNLSNLAATPVKSIVSLRILQTGTNSNPRLGALPSFTNADIVLTPADPEFAQVVAEVMAAATRKGLELQPQLVAVATVIATAAMADPLLAPAVQAAVQSSIKT